MDGILLVDKPEGWTSHDVVAKVRSILNNNQRQKPWPTHGDAMQGAGEQRTKVYGQYSEGAAQPATPQSAPSSSGAAGSAGRQAGAVRRIKVGHTGTLDPAATGLLILVIGSYTKRAEKFSKLDKVYQAEITLGVTSSTGDTEGELTQLLTTNYRLPSRSDVEAVLRQFEGEMLQKPHKYSAVKIDGQRAYKAARAGKTVEIEARKVKIYEITDVEYKYPKLSFTCKVSSGTYIRSLAEDIGAALDTGAYLSALRRTQVGDFKVEKALKIEDLSLQNIENRRALH